MEGSKFNPQAVTSRPWDVNFFHNSTAPSLSIYSLQGALSTSPDTVDPFGQSYYNRSYVFQDACLSDHGPDCNGQLGPILRDLPTLHNCYMFDNVTDSASVQELHFHDDGHGDTLSFFTSRLNKCFFEYCKSISPNFNESAFQSPLYTYGTTSGDFNYGSGGLYVEEICANVATEVNSDVGGIGVYISYWVQSGLAILGLIGTVLWKWIVPNISFIFLGLRHGWPRANRRTRKTRVVAQRHLCRLLTSLTDFHKSQCFFMLATNIAALVAVNRGGLDPQSLQQIYNTWIFLKVVAVNGYLPVSFTLANLYVVDMLSWYIILISAITVALSVATSAVVGKFEPSESDMKKLATFAATGGPADCGYTQPGIYCFLPIGGNGALWIYGSGNIGQGYSTVDKDAYSIMSFCILVMILLLADKSKVQDFAIIRSIQQFISAGGIQRGFDHKLPPQFRVSRRTTNIEGDAAEMKDHHDMATKDHDDESSNDELDGHGSGSDDDKPDHSRDHDAATIIPVALSAEDDQERLIPSPELQSRAKLFSGPSI
ncbi:hypothetical protein ACLMJK_005750 [Lecanora helva]